MMFDRPFWISPHALKRFRERFGSCSDPEIRWMLNVQMQSPEIPDGANMNVSRGPALYYAVLVGNEEATALVSAPKDADIGQLPRAPDVWPVVMTLYPGRKHIRQYRARLERKKRRHRQTKPFQRTWEEWEIETARLMRWVGYTMREIGNVLGRTEKQVERQICERNVGVIQPRWTEAELQTMCDMRFAGKTFAEIAAKLGRSPQACKHKMLRHREWVLSDPRRAAFLRMMYLMKHPGRLLSQMRRADMISACLPPEDIGEEDQAS